MTAAALPVRSERVPAHVWVILAGLVATIFSGHSDELGLPISPDRPLLALGLVLLLLHPERERLRWRPVYLAMAGVVILTLFSWLATGSLTDSYKAFGFLDRIVLPFGMFVVGCLTFTTPFRRLLLVRAAAVTGLYLGLVGVLQVTGTTALLFPRYLAGYAEAGGRVVGPFGGPEAYGMTCAVILLLSVAGLLLDSGHWRLVSLAALGASTVGVVLSMTRSVWVAALLAVLLWIALDRRVRRFLPLALAISAAALVLALIAFPDLGSALNERLTTTRSLYDRTNVNAAAWRAIEEHPLTGIGWLRFVEENVLWVRQADLDPVTTVTIEVHNVFLARAAETGVIAAVLWGLAMLLGPGASVLAKARTVEMATWKLVAAGSIVVWLVPSLLSPNPYVTPNLLIWLIGGIAGRGVLLARRAAAEPHRASTGGLGTRL